MKFEALNDMIPYVLGGKQKVLTMSPYPNVTLAMPGRHAADTAPKGGDFVVMVTDENMGWTDHQFTHTALFVDMYMKYKMTPDVSQAVINDYYDIIKGGSPATWIGNPSATIDPQTFLYAVQCLAVAEHRRYARYEAKFGGRFLPFRFAAGIAEGLWTDLEAADKQKRGRPGVEWLEKDHGVPALTKELMK